MSLLDEKFAKLGVDSAPGQESRQAGSAVVTAWLAHEEAALAEVEAALAAV